MTPQHQFHTPATAPRRWARWLSLLLLPIALFVTGCSSDSSDSDASASPSDSAAASATPSTDAAVLGSLDEVQVTGGFGEAPTVTAAWPVKVNETVSKVLVAGDGATVGATSYIEINYAGVNGRTGSTFDSSYDRGATSTFGLEQVVPGFSNGLEGKHVGDRVLIGVTGADGYDSTGGSTSVDIQVGDTLFFVVDVVGTQLDGPSGDTVDAVAGLPTVSGDINNPQIAIPADTSAPADLVAQPLIKGSGKQVAATDTITVNFTSVTWTDTHVVQSTYASGSNSPQTAALSTLVTGWQTGLTGQTVGSRVLLVVPPAQAYPDGNANPTIAPGTTMVYVVDILFTTASTS